MTITDTRTTNRNYKKPVSTNNLADDVARLGNQVDAIDADVASLFASMSGKADATSLGNYQLLSGRNQPNGYAGLNGSGQIDDTALPSSIKGGLVPKGNWNAATNTPALPAAASGNKGWLYFVTADGTFPFAFASGQSTDVLTGDAVWSDGTDYHKIDSTDRVQSVAGRTGNVVLVMADITDLAKYGLIGASATASALSTVSANNQLLTLTGSSTYVTTLSNPTAGLNYAPFITIWNKSSAVQTLTCAANIIGPGAPSPASSSKSILAGQMVTLEWSTADNAYVAVDGVTLGANTFLADQTVSAAAGGMVHVKNSTSTGTNGLVAGGIDATANDSTNAARSLGSLIWSWVDATAKSAQAVLTQMIAGVTTTVLSITSAGKVNAAIGLQEAGVDLSSKYALAAAGGTQLNAGSTTTWTSNTTLSNVPNLSFPVANGDAYEFEIHFYARPSAGSLNANISGPATSECLYRQDMNDPGGSSTSNMTAINTPFSPSSNGTNVVMRVIGHVKFSAAGTFAVQAAQVTSNASGLSLLGATSLWYKKVN